MSSGKSVNSCLLATWQLPLSLSEALLDSNKSFSCTIKGIQTYINVDWGARCPLESKLGSEILVIVLDNVQGICIFLFRIIDNVTCTLVSIIWNVTITREKTFVIFNQFVIIKIYRIEKLSMKGLSSSSSYF